MKQLIRQTSGYIHGQVAKIARDEKGIGVVEVILILLVLVGLVLIFKDQIVSLARSIFSNISSQANSV